MVVQVRAGREAFATDLTHVWLLSTVDTPMRVQGTRRGKRLPTYVTGMRLFS